MNFSTLVHEYLIQSARKYPDKTALICNGNRLTYREIDAYSSRLALSLLNMGLRRQDRVIVFLDNSVETVISLYGILKAGGVFVILNGSVKSKKLNYIMQDSGPTILISHVSKASVMQDVSELNSALKLIWVGDSKRLPQSSSQPSFSWNTICTTLNPEDTLSLNSEITTSSSRCLDTDLASLIYTSGTTGEPKGVMSTHHNIISASKSIIHYLDNSEEDIILNVLPLSFDYGLYQIIMAFMFGGTVVLEKAFVYQTRIFEILEKEKITGFPIVPTIAAILLNTSTISQYDFRHLRYITNTAAALPVEHIKKLQKLLHHVKIYSMFGLTECKRATYLPPEELDRRPRSVGKAIPNCEAFVLDENGKEIGPGEEGELVIRGANVMQGYWNAPELTKKVFRQGVYPADILLYSGDIFKKDEEGFLYFVRRNDDLIKTRGERVSPKEIENTLCDIEGVLEAAVIGVPDDILGQAIRAFIVPASGNHLMKADILKYCSENLETFMVPQYIDFVTDLPKTVNGKIDKKALIAQT